MQEGSGVTNLQTELNYLDSFKSYCNSSDLGFLGSRGRGRWVGGCLGWSAIVYMSSGMFRGEESSNRIELSRLVQDLLNFGVLGSLWLWGWGGGWGVPPTHVHAHARVVNMKISCKWPPPLGEYLGIPYDVMHVRACACVCTWVGCTLSPPPPPSIDTPHPPRGGPLESFKIQ